MRLVVGFITIGYLSTVQVDTTGFYCEFYIISVAFTFMRPGYCLVELL